MLGKIWWTPVFKLEFCLKPVFEILKISAKMSHFFNTFKTVTKKLFNLFFRLLFLHRQTLLRTLFFGQFFASCRHFVLRVFSLPIQRILNVIFELEILFNRNFRKIYLIDKYSNPGQHKVLSREEVGW